MSRIGNAPIDLPDGVTVEIDDSNVVKAKGPKGELYLEVNKDMIIEVKDGQVLVNRPTEQKRHKAYHGLYRSLISNMVSGVKEGYKKQLDLVGVGFRANSTGQNLELSVGFSHPIIVQLPKEVKVTTETEKGKSPRVILESIDKQLLGQVAARIRAIRKPEPYKGKGIRYSDEIVRRKAGKAAAK